MKKTWLLGMLGLFLIGCGDAADGKLAPDGAASDEIIGGVPTKGYPAVLALYGRQPGADKGILCSATLISPTVVLTAAHCVDPDVAGEGNEYTAIFGSDINSPSGIVKEVPVAETHFNPLFNKNLLLSGNDIAVAILSKPVTDIAPIPFNRRPLTQSMVNQNSVIVGYGLNDSFRQKGAGVKREATVPLNGFDELFMQTGVWFKGICNGDSGGPVLMDIDGAQTVVGVNSFGFIFCLFQSYSTRVDKYVSFIDPSSW